MRICFLCGEYPPARHGGIGSMTQVLGRALAAAGHEVRVAGVYPSLDGLPDAEDDRGVQVRRFPMPQGAFGWTRARRLLFETVRRWVDRGEVDLVEAPDWEGWAAGWPALRAPVVVRLHGSLSYFAREMKSRINWAAWCLEMASFHRADQCCSTSHYTARRTESIFGPRRRPVNVLFNPVEVPSDPPKPRCPNRVVFTGTLTPKKGVRPLIEAWPGVVRECPGAELRLFGKDEGMQAQLEALLPADIQETVRFYGHVSRDRVQSELQTCRVAVFPSWAEAFSMAPIEAMAQGCPVIYTNRSSGPELIDHGRTGLLIDPGHPEEIAAAIVSLMRDAGRASRLGEAGRQDVARRFATNVLVARNEEFYRSAIRSCE